MHHSSKPSEAPAQSLPSPLPCPGLAIAFTCKPSPPHPLRGRGTTPSSSSLTYRTSKKRTKQPRQPAVLLAANLKRRILHALANETNVKKTKHKKQTLPAKNTRKRVCKTSSESPGMSKNHIVLLSSLVPVTAQNTHRRWATENSLGHRSGTAINKWPFARVPDRSARRLWEDGLNKRRTSIDFRPRVGLKHGLSQTSWA